jgi:transposase
VAVLCTQQRWPHVCGQTASTAFQKPSAPPTTASSGPWIAHATRHIQAILKAQINKTDRNDARRIAQMMRVGLYRPSHKTLRSQSLRMLLTHRKLLQSKAMAIENDQRGALCNFGLKVGMVGTVKFEARFKELVLQLHRSFS